MPLRNGADLKPGRAMVPCYWDNAGWREETRIYLPVGSAVGP
jgi:hypothetical protein